MPTTYYEQPITPCSGGFGQYQADPINGEAWDDADALAAEMAQGIADQGGELVELTDGCAEHLDIRGRIHNEPARVFAIVWDDPSRSTSYIGIASR